MHLKFYLPDMGVVVWVQLWGVQGPALMLFLFYENVFGIRPLSVLSSQRLGFPSCRVVYPWGFSLGNCLQFPYQE